MTPESNPASTPAPAPIQAADAALINDWATWLESAKGCRPRTLESYRLVLRRLCEFAATLPRKPLLMALEPVEIEHFAGVWLHKLGVVARSRKPYVSALRGFFGWAKARGHVDRDLVLELRHPRIGRPLPSALSLASAEKLMWAPDLGTFKGIRDAAILAMLLGGLRVSGVVGLNEGDVRPQDIDGKPRLVVHVIEKGEKERVLPLPREAEMLLRVYLDHDELKTLPRDVIDRKGRADKVLFVNMRNTSVPAHERMGEKVRLNRHTVWKLIQHYGEKAGVPAGERHPHAFRHLFGVELAEDDVDLLTRQHLLGHADPKSTEIYTEMSMRRKTRVMDKSGPLGKMKTPVSELLKRLPSGA